MDSFKLGYQHEKWSWNAASSWSSFLYVSANKLAPDCAIGKVHAICHGRQHRATIITVEELAACKTGSTDRQNVTEPTMTVGTWSSSSGGPVPYGLPVGAQPRRYRSGGTSRTKLYTSRYIWFSGMTENVLIMMSSPDRRNDDLAA